MGRSPDGSQYREHALPIKLRKPLSVMRIYVANCTTQIQQINYRLDFQTSGGESPLAAMRAPRRQDIPPGRQAPIGGDLTQEQVDSIVKQISAFGALRVGDVSRSGRKIHLVYDIDKPVPDKIIRSVNEYSKDVLSHEGELRRKHAAIVANDIVTNAVAEQLAITSVADDVAPRDFRVEVEQLDGENRIEEGFRVDPDAKPQPPPAYKGGRRRAA